MKNNNVELLRSATDLLQVATRRNELEKESKDVVQKCIKETYEANKFIKTVETFARNSGSHVIEENASNLILAVREKICESEKKAKEPIQKDKMASKLTWEIEEMKEELLELLKSASIEKIKTEEIPKEKLRELVLIVLMLNHEDYTFTEENLFESVADFHEMLKQSNDTVLTDLVYKGSITNNVLDLFLGTIS